MKTQDGKKAIKASKKDNKRKREDKPDSENNENKSNGNWKKKFKQAIKTPNVKTVMAVLAEGEGNNQALVAAFQANMAPMPVPMPPLPPAPVQVYFAPPVQAPQENVSALQAAMPATNFKLQSILRKPHQ